MSAADMNPGTQATLDGQRLAHARRAMASEFRKLAQGEYEPPSLERADAAVSLLRAIGEKHSLSPQP